MLKLLLLCCLVGGATSCAHAPKLSETSESNDPFLWLEDIQGERALKWVEEQNQQSLARLKGDPRYTKIRGEIAKIVYAEDKLPSVRLEGGKIRNFWQDKIHVQGILRETTVRSYQSPHPRWETLLDLDALSKQEHELWVYKGRSCLPPKYRRCLITLSRGGKDASVVREYDLEDRKFVDGGFVVQESKHRVDWKDLNTIWVGTDFGPGSLTKSGYPRIVKLWRRGTPLGSATTVYEGQDTDVAVEGSTVFTPEGNFDLVQRIPSFFEQQTFLYDFAGKLHRLQVPDTVQPQGVFQGRWLLIPREPWRVGDRELPAGSLVTVDLRDPEKLDPRLVLAKPANGTILDTIPTRTRLFVETLENVRSAFYSVDAPENGAWTARLIHTPFAGASASLESSSAWEDQWIVQSEDYLTPRTQYLQGPESGSVLKRSPRRFDAARFRTEQRFAVSRDGTRIPYFLVLPKRAKFDGGLPTILNGYGGFEVSSMPYYLGAFGKVWLERGGAFAVANIRGGGEFGPEWHRSAILENRQRAFDDFIAVAEDLIATKVTSPRRLGISGGSNGGLLVGAAFTQRPELFHAVLCQVPLLDMLRYSKLLAGASWMGEYGDPDDARMREVIRHYSPYQNLSAAREYPEVLIATSTGDDRVHPGHARKMAARMRSLGKPVLYYEQLNGGHGSGANLEQHLDRWSREHTYFIQKLMD